MAAPSMNQLAKKFADKKIGSVFIYTHEAHPGENYPHFPSLTQKYQHAQDLKDILGVTRPIYLDSLDGACHRRYGSMPNMTWIFNRGGIVQYRGNWTDVDSVERSLVYLLEINQRRKNRETLAPFKVEKLEYRKSDREGFEKGLARSGPKAVEEYKNAF